MSEPTTEAGRRLNYVLAHLPPGPEKTQALIDLNILLRAIEAEARADALPALRRWLKTRRGRPWSPGFSDEFKRGYDTAVEEAENALAVDDPTLILAERQP
jgi:hypothetical protein